MSQETINNQSSNLNQEATQNNQNLLMQAQTKVSMQEASTDTKKDIIRKFTSRKFLMSAAGVLTGIFGMIGFSNNVTAVIVFAFIEIASILGFLFVEGNVDGKAVTMSVEFVTELLDMVNQLMVDNGIDTTVSADTKGNIVSVTGTSSTVDETTMIYDSNIEEK